MIKGLHEVEAVIKLGFLNHKVHTHIHTYIHTYKYICVCVCVCEYTGHSNINTLVALTLEYLLVTVILMLSFM